MVYITQIRLSGGTGVQHISHVYWEQPSPGRSGTYTRQQMVDYINRGNDVFVRGPGNTSDAKVVVVNANPPRLKAAADGREANNLLSLSQNSRYVAKGNRVHVLKPGTTGGTTIATPTRCSPPTSSCCPVSDHESLCRPQHPQAPPCVGLIRQRLPARSEAVASPVA